MGKIEELFLNKCIKDQKMEEMHKIQVELKESKENVSQLQKDIEEIKKCITKKKDEFTKMQSFNESLIKEVKNLNQEIVVNQSGKIMIQGKS
jgi:peptidoglycan hydrolase CwlO-like protein